ncbi:hypothetical protein KVR01_013214 [Diaporthe batatas]|uniref:uncharacterized protein n=1 Tax=Diaporthe batatas TaxID=748121 RepID=UPI001D04AA05|nr:uncharacterized protein KVR01_013214 [Diaporthe batatas]KAG8156992.1 hypothetical protein KVR01_013214 [Diaporthe batatas]
MQFSIATVAFFVNLALAVAVPETGSAGMVQKLDTRDVSDALIFGRSFPCASNDPTTCCACRGGFGTCINGVCSCNGGDC